MKSNLNILAIQYYPEEIEKSLEKIKGGVNIIYSNLKSSINLSGMKIKSRKFDTMLYNEESKVLILLMRDGKIKKEDLISFLENNNKEYVEIIFNSKNYDYKDGDNVPELWFAKERYILSDALADSISKGIDNCIYYPAVDGHMNIGFLTSFERKINIDGRKFKGLLRLEDKIILIINEFNNVNKYGESLNMFYNDIIKVIKSYNLEYKVDYNERPDLYVENFSEKVKSLRKIY